MKQLLLDANNGFDGIIAVPVRWVVKPNNKPYYNRFWTWPTGISLTRIPFAFAIVYVLLFGNHPVLRASILFVAAMLTDKIDGVAARIEGISYWGGLMDPCCDKAFVAICSLVFYKQYWHIAYMLGTIEALLFVAPFVALIRRDFDARSNIWGKFKFAFECVAILTFILRFPTVGNWLLITAIPFAVWSIKGKAQEILSRSN